VKSMRSTKVTPEHNAVYDFNGAFVRSSEEEVKEGDRGSSAMSSSQQPFGTPNDDDTSENFSKGGRLSEKKLLKKA